MKDRGISVHPTIIIRWVHEYRNLVYQIEKRKNKKQNSASRLEFYIKVKEGERYLYRVIDGHTLDIQLYRTRDHQAIYMFMERLRIYINRDEVLNLISIL